MMTCWWYVFSKCGRCSEKKDDYVLTLYVGAESAEDAIAKARMWTGYAGHFCASRVEDLVKWT